MERHAHEDRWERLLADLSHDLRTPLNAILGLTELMTLEAYGPMGDDRYGEFARDIHDAGAELRRHIDELLHHSHMANGPLSTGTGES